MPKAEFPILLAATSPLFNSSALMLRADDQ